MADSDERLLRRIALGDREAFRELYQRYYPRLFGFVFRMTRRADQVEEVVQETLLAAWQGARRFDGRSRPSTWILGIAYRQALKASRRRRRQEEVPQWVPPAEPEGADSLLARREEASAIGRAMAELPPEQRAVMELTFFQGMPYREIADVLGCPVNTVKTRMFHARRRLRRRLPELGIVDDRGASR